MKTIKIIDLLNKIANGEEVPKKIKYDDEIYTYTKIYREGIKYVNKERELDDTYRFLLYSVKKLNDEVEIIKEDKKIEKLDTKKTTDFGAEYVRENRNKINELIDIVNELNKEVNR